MLLECPHCQAHYDIHTDVVDAVFVCHRCGLEFSPDNQAEQAIEQGPEQESQQPWAALHWLPAQNRFPAPPWLIAPPDALQTDDDSIDAPSAQLEMDMPDTIIADDEDDEIAPLSPESAHESHVPDEQITAPTRKNAHIWPWFMVIMIVIAGSGFWLQQDAWLDNRWFRSTLINMGVAMPMRAKDWLIIPESVQPEWIRSDDGGRVLRVRGVIKNLLSSDLPAPQVAVHFFSTTKPDHQVGETVLEITNFPVGGANQAQANVNRIPIAALGSQTFILLLESVPEKTGDFTLTPSVP